MDQIKLEKPENGEHGSGSVIAFNGRKNMDLSEQVKRLPISRYRNEVLYLAGKNQVLIVTGETGCGKSTQVCKFFKEAGYSENNFRVVVTEPRRLAVMSISSRVAEEMNEELGGVVGYEFRFEKKVDEKLCKIVFMTEETLIQEMMYDPMLSSYSVVIVDEVHERTVNTDVLLSLVAKVLLKRKNMRLVLCSALFNIKDVYEFFVLNNISVGVFDVSERTFEIEVRHLKGCVADYVKSSCELVLKIHENEPEGDILVFLTSVEEVEEAVEIVNRQKFLNSKKLNLFPVCLHGNLHVQEQLKVFCRAEANHRKVIFATNIAETSVTILNVAFVVDCGFTVQKYFDCELKCEVDIKIKISKETAVQRAGRAGRTRKGVVYRLYNEEEFEKLNEKCVVELQRRDISQTILNLKALNIVNILRFPFINTPPSFLLANACQMLYSLNFIDDECQLTEKGVVAAEIPLHPIISKLLISSFYYECTEEILTICAMMQLSSIYFKRPGKRDEMNSAKDEFACKEGDHLTFVNIYKAYISNNNINWCKKHFLNGKSMFYANTIRNNLLSVLRKKKFFDIKSTTDHVKIRKCLCSGLFSKAARLTRDGWYEGIDSKKKLHIHHSSVYFKRDLPEWVLYSEIVFSNNKYYIKDVSEISNGWLLECAPHYFN